jgi:hypothetical protein
LHRRFLAPLALDEPDAKTCKFNLQFLDPTLSECETHIIDSQLWLARFGSVSGGCSSGALPRFGGWKRILMLSIAKFGHST